MEKIRILCYGASNPWGYISGSDHQRYGLGERYKGDNTIVNLADTEINFYLIEKVK